MDLVVPLREHTRQGPNPARWMLRTVHHHLPQVDRVVIVGDLPDWAEPDVWIPSRNDRPKFTNIGNHLERALRARDVSDEFIWTNDDIFLLADLTPMPVYARGPIDPYAANLKPDQGHADHRAFIDGIRRQAALAKLWGYDPAATLNADCHAPIPLEKDRLAAVLERRDQDDPAIEAGHFRMIYGLGLEATVIKDPKVRGDAVPDDDRVIVSTSTRSWEGPCGDRIRNLYWRPSPWET